MKFFFKSYTNISWYLDSKLLGGNLKKILKSPGASIYPKSKVPGVSILKYKNQKKSCVKHQASPLSPSRKKSINSLRSMSGHSFLISKKWLIDTENWESFFNLRNKKQLNMNKLQSFRKGIPHQLSLVSEVHFTWMSCDVWFHCQFVFFYICRRIGRFKLDDSRCF
jgi:hypothetical protein